ncbi:MAG TPA: sugar phosphate nucleotidyltransferase, partial [Candidatus Hydrogenedentes bacterium]|nr:sugar phosphate nucleotidyltransferase [Candidatus Hydrogenedentota bacterium]
MNSCEKPIRTAVIMAGGSGERFWPLSRRLRPKQLLRLAHPEKTLLEQSIERVEPIVPKENIFIATARHLKDAILA